MGKRYSYINRCQLLLKVLVCFIFIAGIINSSKAQNQLLHEEGKLQLLFDQLVQSANDEDRMQLSGEIRQKLKTLLLNEESFTYPFDSLNYLGKVLSPDQTFRLYSWNIVLEDGSYRYFAFIQRADNKAFTIEELQDMGEKPENCMTMVTKSDNWPGALYYQIIPFLRHEQKLYLLLGWDGNNPQTNRKLIEVLHFDKTGKAVFGAPVIDWRGKRLTRVIFEYAKQAQMALRYEASHKQVVFDHLAPTSLRYVGKYEHYGPDFSYDALILENGTWKLVEDVDVRKFQQPDTKK